MVVYLLLLDTLRYILLYMLLFVLLFEHTVLHTVLCVLHSKCSDTLAISNHQCSFEIYNLRSLHELLLVFYAAN